MNLFKLLVFCGINYKLRDPQKRRNRGTKIMQDTLIDYSLIDGDFFIIEKLFHI